MCETLVTELVTPVRTELFCDLANWQKLSMPHCNLPGACHVDPTCSTFEKARTIAGHVLNAGDLYCDFRKIDPKQMISNLGQGLYSDAVKLTTGGLSSVLFTAASAHIDIMECGANALSNDLKAMILKLASETGLSRDASFHPIDVDNIRISPRSTDLGKVYLREGYAAITLGDVVVMQDGFHRVLKNWKASWDDLRNGKLTREEEEALLLVIHELTHVRQYRNMGKEQFINRYLGEALKNGYANISTELEASEVEAQAQRTHERIMREWSTLVWAVTRGAVSVGS